MHQLTELCVSECYFPYNNLIWKLYNSGLIGLSIVFVLSECYLQRPEEWSIALSLAFNISPRPFKLYIDDSHARFENKQKSLQLLEILNKPDSPIQYTIKFENNQKQLNFLDIAITNNESDSVDFKILRKQSSRTYKSNLTQTWHPIFPFHFLKGLLSRAYKICSEQYIGEEIQFLIDVFPKNGYERKYWNR